MDSNLVIKNQPVLSKIFNNIRKTNNNVQAYMLVGEDKEKIFNSLNFHPLYNIAESNMIEIDRFEKEIGVIIYEKD